MRGATKIGLDIITGIAFQSTHPVRGATDGPQAYLADLGISIHAPREGCDAVLARCVA